MVKKYNKKYIPDRADIVWVSFSPTKGHEQSGYRPAIVVSPKVYNKASGLCIILPITSNKKDYPFEIYFENKNISGVILSDQIRNVDWVARKIIFEDNLDLKVFENVKENLLKIIN